MRMADTIKGWKATLRKEKTKRRMKHMVELSPSHHTLDEVDDIIQSEAMWKDFTKVAGKCLHCVGTKQLGTLRLVDVILNLRLSVFSTSSSDK